MRSSERRYWQERRFQTLVAGLGILAAALVFCLTVLDKVVDSGGIPTAAYYGLAGVLLAVSAFALVQQARRQMAVALERTSVDMRSLVEVVDADGLPPVLTRVSPYKVGVSASAYMSRQDPYIPRDVDRELQRKLRSSPEPVVLVGVSKSGKSRTAFECMKIALPHARVITPRRPISREAFLAMVEEFKDSHSDFVLWLDDLQSHEVQTIPWAALSDLVPGWHVFVTMSAADLGDILGGALGLVGPGKSALAAETAVVLSASLSEGESASATRLYPQEAFKGPIGETFISGQALTARLAAAEISCPVGWRLVHALSRLQVMGWPRAFSEQQMRSILRTVGEPRATEREMTELAEAIAWGREPLISKVAILESSEAGYRVIDYLANGVAPRPALDASLLNWALDNGTAADLGAVAYAQYLRGDWTSAKRCWERASELPDGHSAMCNLARAYHAAGNMKLGDEWFERAAQSGSAEERAEALLAMGEQARFDGDERRAAKAFKRALTGESTPATGSLLIALGHSLSALGDTHGAEEAYSRVLEQTDSNLEAHARVHLAEMLDSSGDSTASREMYEAAARGSDWYWRARHQLSHLLTRDGRKDDAVAVLKSAVNDPGIAAVRRDELLHCLCVMLRDQGRSREVVEVLTRSRRWKPEELSAVLLADLGGAYLASGHTKEGEAALATVSASPDPHARHGALLEWGKWHLGNGDTTTAVVRFKEASTLGTPSMRGLALNWLGYAYGESGDKPAALDAYGLAIAEGDDWQRGYAAANSAEILVGRGELGRARRMMDLASKSSNSGAGSRAEWAVGLQDPFGGSPAESLLNKGLYWLETGDLDSARATFEVLRSNRSVAIPAAFYLAVCLRSQGKVTEARAILKRVNASDDPEFGPLASEALRQLS